MIMYSQVVGKEFNFVKIRYSNAPAAVVLEVSQFIKLFIGHLPFLHMPLSPAVLPFFFFCVLIWNCLYLLHQDAVKKLN